MSQTRIAFTWTHSALTIDTVENDDWESEDIDVAFF